jgi:hypothetical protein
MRQFYDALPDNLRAILKRTPLRGKRRSWWTAAMSLVKGSKGIKHQSCR